MSSNNVKFAVLLLGWQNDAISPEGKLYSSLAPILRQTDAAAKVSLLLNAARKSGGIVVHSPITIPSASDSASDDISFPDAFQGAFEEGTWGSELAIETSPSDIVLKARSSQDAFDGTDLQSILEDRTAGGGLKVLFIMGATSNGSVAETFMRSTELLPEVRVVAIEDASVDVEDAHFHSMGMLLPMYGEVMSAEKASGLMGLMSGERPSIARTSLAYNNNNYPSAASRLAGNNMANKVGRGTMAITGIERRIGHFPEVPGDHAGFSLRVVDNNKVKLDPFIAIDDFFTRFPAAFLDHPHRGFESATFVLPEQESEESRLLYYDSTLGQEEKSLGAGGLVRMICGSGISHCELIDHEEHLMRAINIWFNYPEDEKLCKPWSCVHNMGTKEMPMKVKDGVRSIVLQGTFAGLTGNCFHNCSTKLDLFHVTLMPNRTAVFEIPQGWNAVVYCINGAGFINGDYLRCCEGPEDKLSSSSSTPTFAKKSIDDPDYDPNEKRYFQVSSSSDSVMEVMYFAGEPIGIPMIVFDIKDDGSSGTYVASSKEDIKDWLGDWIDAKNGFEYQDTWQSPGMQKIKKLWNGQQRPAQDRDEPLTARISSVEVMRMREEATGIVAGLREKDYERDMLRKRATQLRATMVTRKGIAAKKKDPTASNNRYRATITHRMTKILSSDM